MQNIHKREYCKVTAFNEKKQTSDTHNNTDDPQ